MSKNEIEIIILHGLELLSDKRGENVICKVCGLSFDIDGILGQRRVQVGDETFQSVYGNMEDGTFYNLIFVGEENTRKMEKWTGWPAKSED